MTEILDTETAKKRIRSKRFFRVRSGLNAISYSDDRSWIDQILEHAELNELNKLYVPFRQYFGIREKHWKYVTLRLWLKRQKEMGTLFGFSLSEEPQILQLGLPPELYDFQDQLEYLNLSKCKLHELPEGIEGFTQLQQIDVSQNKLRDVDALSKLELQFLDISRNELPHYPKWFENIPNCKLDLSIEWANSLYKETWGSILTNEIKAFGYHQWYNGSIYGYEYETLDTETLIENMQEGLKKIEDNWNTLGLRSKSKRASKKKAKEHPIYEPPVRAVVRAFLSKTRVHRGRLRFIDFKRYHKSYQFLALWALQKLNRHASVYFAGMCRVDYENWNEQYGVTLPNIRHFAEKTANYLYTMDKQSVSRNHYYRYDTHRIVTHSPNHHNTDNVNFPYQRIRYDLDEKYVHNKKLSVCTDMTIKNMKSYITGTSNWGYFADRKIQNIAFANRHKHLDTHYYSLASHQENIWMREAPKEIVFHDISNMDEIINGYRNLEALEKIVIRLCDTTMPDLSGCKNLKELEIQNARLFLFCKDKLPKGIKIVINDTYFYLTGNDWSKWQLYKTRFYKTLSEYRYQKNAKGEKVYKSMRIDLDNIPYQIDKKDKSKKGREQLHDRHIELRNCDLTEVPEWLKESKRAHTIDLRENNITHVPQWLLKLRRVKRIILDHNPITSVDHIDYYNHAKTLKLLSLRHCELSNVPPQINAHNDSYKGIKFVIDLRHNLISHYARGALWKWDGELYVNALNRIIQINTLYNIRLEGNPFEKVAT